MTSGPQLSSVGCAGAGPKREFFNSILCCHVEVRRDASFRRRFGIRRGESLALRNAVEIEHALAHVERVARHADEPLDERRREVGPRLSRLIRRHEHDDVAVLGARVARQMRVRERDRRTVGELVDEQPVADEQRRNHASRRNAERLDEQRLHERGRSTTAPASDLKFSQSQLADRLRRFGLPPPRACGDDVLGRLAGRRFAGVRWSGGSLAERQRGGGFMDARIRTPREH